MLTAIMVTVIMLTFIMLTVITLSVAEPIKAIVSVPDVFYLIDFMFLSKAGVL